MPAYKLHLEAEELLLDLLAEASVHDHKTHADIETHVVGILILKGFHPTGKGVRVCPKLHGIRAELMIGGTSTMVEV